MSDIMTDVMETLVMREAADEIKRLQVINADLLAELTALVEWVEEFALPAMDDDTDGGTAFLASARAAIAKATNGDDR